MAGLLVVAGIVAAMAEPVLRPHDGVVLTGEEARKLTHQCSRGAPQNILGDWTPTARQIAELEARLPAEVLPELRKRASWPRSSVPELYFRQYAGLVLKDRKIIYVNGFPGGEWINANTYILKGAIGHPGWRKTAVMVCDGGPGYFGAEFDPVSQHFTGLAFNGAA